MRTTTSVLAATAALALSASAAAALPRSTSDRPDQWPAGTPLVHAVYVIPSDGADRALETSGVLEASFGSFQRLLSVQTGGRARVARSRSPRPRTARPGSVACAGSRLAARASLRAGRIACSLRLPHGARGKRLLVMLTATRGDERVSRTASFRVR